MRVPRPKPKKQEFHLSDHLILAPFIAKNLGFEKWGELLDFFKDVLPEGFEADGHSMMYRRLVTRSNIQLPISKLAEYDENIRRHVEWMSRKRLELLRLKYFQYLAALFTEIYFDALFKDPVGLVNDLSRYAETPEVVRRMVDVSYSRRDMHKIAYAMATGSGKTLLMHLNLLQFRHYNKGPKAIQYENTIVIAPTGDMSEYHFKELELSGIPAEIYEGQYGYFAFEEKDKVKVIDIYKLKLPQDKRGEGVTFNIKDCGSSNLVLVDEGHKGHRSEDRKWKRVREELAGKGFTFEYSATFAQIVSVGSERGADTLTEYAKAILFDYSYKYFHRDGYGKEFRVLNLARFEEKKDHKDTVLVANLLSFYEQMLVHRELGGTAREYNVEGPLWIFVGTSIDRDVFDVVDFFAKVLDNKDNWLNEKIRAILEGHSGLPADDGNDAFAKGYNEKVLQYLRKGAMAVDDLVSGIYRDLFRAGGGGASRKLHVVDLKNSAGELGLKVGTGTECFGLIYIEDRSGLMKKIQSSLPGVVIETGAMERSLFSGIGDSRSSVNVLIGAKKFIEGWNCWRVSSMGLLNVGRGEGPQIIQLFGRGVRLKGRGGSLKRSMLDPTCPEHLEILETLGVFGIRADYMERFKEMIETEEIPLLKPVDIPIQRISNIPPSLQIPVLNKKPEDFLSEQVIRLVDTELSDVKPLLNLVPKTQVVDSRPSSTLLSQGTPLQQRTIREEFLQALDWDALYLDALKYRSEREYYNLTFTKEDLRNALCKSDGDGGEKYKLWALEEDLNPGGDFSRLVDLQDVAFRLIKDLMDRRYAIRKNRWKWRNSSLVTVKPDADRPYIPSKYTVWIETSREKEIEDMKRLAESGDLQKKECEGPVRNVFYERHLFQPLLAAPPEGSDYIRIEPTGLNDGEAQFVRDLAAHIQSGAGLPGPGAAVYLVRNFTRGKGIGFGEEGSFYPDFIMWVEKDDQQWLTFVDPKGLTHTGPGHFKIEALRMARENPPPGLTDAHPSGFIISQTPFNLTWAMYPEYPRDMEKYEKKNNIIFRWIDDGRPSHDYIERLFRQVMEAG